MYHGDRNHAPKEAQPTFTTAATNSGQQGDGHARTAVERKKHLDRGRTDEARGHKLQMC